MRSRGGEEVEEARRSAGVQKSRPERVGLNYTCSRCGQPKRGHVCTWRKDSSDPRAQRPSQLSEVARLLLDMEDSLPIDRMVDHFQLELMRWRVDVGKAPSVGALGEQARILLASLHAYDKHDGSEALRAEWRKDGEARREWIRRTHTADLTELSALISQLSTIWLHSSPRPQSSLPADAVQAVTSASEGELEAVSAATKGASGRLPVAKGGGHIGSGVGGARRTLSTAGGAKGRAGSGRSPASGGRSIQQIGADSTDRRRQHNTTDGKHRKSSPTTQRPKQPNQYTYHNQPKSAGNAGIPRGKEETDEHGLPCPELGRGWRRISKRRVADPTSTMWREHVDHIYVSPDGQRFNSRVKASSAQASHTPGAQDRAADGYQQLRRPSWNLALSR